MLKMKCIKLILIITLPFLANSLNAQNDAERLLKSLQNKFETIKDLSADIVQVSMGQTLAGKLMFKKENSFHLDLTNNVIVSNGTYVWNFNKREKKVIISDYDDNDPSAISINKIVYEYPSKSTIASESDAEENILILTPKTNLGINFNSIKIWINKENLISKVLINTNSGTTEVRFSNYKLNQNIPDSRFTFIPPEGSTVIDLR